MAQLLRQVLAMCLRTALKAVLKPLPKEIELLIYDYMRPTTKGHIEVAMRWQIHPFARVVKKIFDPPVFYRYRIGTCPM